MKSRRERRLTEFRVHGPFRLPIIGRGRSRKLDRGSFAAFLNTFTHVAGVFDSVTKELSVWVNGVKETFVVAGFSTIFDQPEPLLIAAGDLGSNVRDFTNGLIDEVEIYDHALSAAEIEAIFNAGNAGKCKVTTVAIDIKPGSFPNSINLSSAGVVPVAILSSATFDATQVDSTTVSLAGAGVKLIGKGDKYACSAEDVNEDGLLDLVCHVLTAHFLIEPGDSVAVLEATTFSGQPIRGEDSINRNMLFWHRPTWSQEEIERRRRHASSCSQGVEVRGLPDTLDLAIGR